MPNSPPVMRWLKVCIPETMTFAKTKLFDPSADNWALNLDVERHCVRRYIEGTRNSSFNTRASTTFCRKITPKGHISRKGIYIIIRSSSSPSSSLRIHCSTITTAKNHPQSSPINHHLSWSSSSSGWIIIIIIIPIIVIIIVSIFTIMSIITSIIDFIIFNVVRRNSVGCARARAV